MKFLRKLFGRDQDDETEDVPIQLDQELRSRQLLTLEKALDALANEMRGCESLDNLGWRVRVNEYSRLAGEAMMLRRGEITREGVLDLVFEIRPLFTGAPPRPERASGAVAGRDDGRRRGPPRAVAVGAWLTSPTGVGMIVQRCPRAWRGCLVRGARQRQEAV